MILYAAKIAVCLEITASLVFGVLPDFDRAVTAYCINGWIRPAYCVRHHILDLETEAAPMENAGQQNIGVGKNFEIETIGNRRLFRQII